MNFLEQLVAEWYGYQGYFVRTNIKFAPRSRGGYGGEMDVICYKPETSEFIYIEASTDAYSWSKRKRRFEKKFTDARENYMSIFPFKQLHIRPRQIALVGFNQNSISQTASWKSLAPNGSPWGNIGIEVIHMPDFLKQINTKLRNQNPQNDAVPETYPLLRAIQYSSFYLKSS